MEKPVINFSLSYFQLLRVVEKIGEHITIMMMMNFGHEMQGMIVDGVMEQRKAKWSPKQDC